jgi:hypothetical protein
MSISDEAGQDKADAHGVEHKSVEQDDGTAALHRRFASATPEVHAEMTKKLLRKVDFHLLPLLVLM